MFFNRLNYFEGQKFGMVHFRLRSSQCTIVYYVHVHVYIKAIFIETLTFNSHLSILHFSSVQHQIR